MEQVMFKNFTLPSTGNNIKPRSAGTVVKFMEGILFSNKNKELLLEFIEQFKDEATDTSLSYEEHLKKVSEAYNEVKSFVRRAIDLNEVRLIAPNNAYMEKREAAENKDEYQIHQVAALVSNVGKLKLYRDYSSKPTFSMSFDHPAEEGGFDHEYLSDKNLSVYDKYIVNRLIEFLFAYDYGSMAIDVAYADINPNGTLRIYRFASERHQVLNRYSAAFHRAEGNDKNKKQSTLCLHIVDIFEGLPDLNTVSRHEYKNTALTKYSLSEGIESDELFLVAVENLKKGKVRVVDAWLHPYLDGDDHIEQINNELVEVFEDPKKNKYVIDFWSAFLSQDGQATIKKLKEDTEKMHLSRAALWSQHLK